jgi:hypothetical protein
LHTSKSLKSEKSKQSKKLLKIEGDKWYRACLASAGPESNTSTAKKKN